MSNPIQWQEPERLPIAIPLLIRGENRFGRRFEERTTTIDINNRGLRFLTGQQLGNDTLLDLEIFPPPGVAGIMCKFVTRGRVVHQVTLESRCTVTVQFIEPLKFSSLHTDEVVS